MGEKILQEIKEALKKGDREGVVRLTKEALEKGAQIREILNDGLIAGMDIIGAAFKKNEVFIP